MMISQAVKLWQRKRTIDALVQELNAKYPVPVDDFSTLEGIAEDYDIHICFCEAALIPISSRKKRTTILPETYCSEADIANCVHELGHILLGTASEAEAIYFAYRIQKTGFLSDHLISAKYLVLSIAEVYQEYQNNPDFVEKSFASLAEQGISPYLIDDAKRDTYRILNLAYAALECHQINEEQQDRIFSKLYPFLRRIGP